MSLAVGVYGRPVPSVPGPTVVTAFGVSGVPERLPGGSGGTFAVGEVVLRREEVPDWAVVVAEVMAAVGTRATTRTGRPPCRSPGH